MVNEKAEKSGLPAMAAISGVRILPTNEVTTAPKAAPMATATAKSTTMPRKRNFLNPASMICLLESNIVFRIEDVGSREDWAIVKSGNRVIETSYRGFHGLHGFVNALSSCSPETIPKPIKKEACLF